MTENQHNRRPSGPPPSSFRNVPEADQNQAEMPGSPGISGEPQQVPPHMQYVYVQPSPGSMPERPEKRNQWVVWLVVGLFIWPFLFVALKVYGDDQSAYSMAMDEYRRGIDPDWYWKGFKARPDAVVGAPVRTKSNGIFKTVMVTLFIIAAVWIGGLFALQAMVSPNTGGTTIDDLGGGTVLWVTQTTND